MRWRIDARPPPRPPRDRSRWSWRRAEAARSTSSARRRWAPRSSRARGFRPRPMLRMVVDALLDLLVAARQAQHRADVVVGRDRLEHEAALVASPLGLAELRDRPARPGAGALLEPVRRPELDVRRPELVREHRDLVGDPGRGQRRSASHRRPLPASHSLRCRSLRVCGRVSRDADAAAGPPTLLPPKWAALHHAAQPGRWERAVWARLTRPSRGRWKECGSGHHLVDRRRRDRRLAGRHDRARRRVPGDHRQDRAGHRRRGRRRVPRGAAAPGRRIT